MSFAHVASSEHNELLAGDVHMYMGLPLPFTINQIQFLR